MGEKIAIILALNFFYYDTPIKGIIVFTMIASYGALAYKY